ncbi:ATP-binding cassette domain-containing protein [Streptomyces bobili]
MVRACEADPGEWEPWWKEAEAEVEGPPVADERGENPSYPGLARFEPDNRALFFCRDWLAEESRLLVSEHRFTGVFGASGSGKSSLLWAGGDPPPAGGDREPEGPAVLRVFTPGARPAETYGHLLAPDVGEPDIWVLVDQSEEVFTLCRDKDERTRFIDVLPAARDAGSRLRVLIAVRADFYAQCAERREQGDALRGAALLVGPMTADELREAVVRPAQVVGLLVEHELTARMWTRPLTSPVPCRCSRTRCWSHSAAAGAAS